MWRYDSRTGRLYSPINGKCIAVGYSGRGRGFNNPDLEHIIGLGPIPVGCYVIAPPRHSRRVGRVAMDLGPLGHNARGRSAFMIHGDNQRMNYTASSGCIVLDYTTRLRIATGPWDVIEVFDSRGAGEPPAVRESLAFQPEPNFLPVMTTVQNDGRPSRCM